MRGFDLAHKIMTDMDVNSEQLEETLREAGWVPIEEVIESLREHDPYIADSIEHEFKV